MIALTRWLVSLSLILALSMSPALASIAALYPSDIGIEQHPDVLFVERFDDSVANISARWSETKNPGSLSLVTDVPDGSPANTFALQIAGTNGGGHLYKNLAAAGLAQADQLHVRYYIKHPTGSNASHSGIWMGGWNPPSNWPMGIAGKSTPPTGSDHFVAASEDMVSDAHNFDHYNYWMGMRPDGSGTYWGNVLLNDPSVKTPLGAWLCVEHMVKLNNPVTSLNGEHAIWLNGQLVSHLGLNFPQGYWVGGRFFQDPSVATVFEGFQWRNDTSLTLNWIWLQNYTPSSPQTPLLFDHVVLATTYIGCLSDGGANGLPPAPPTNLTIQ